MDFGQGHHNRQTGAVQTLDREKPVGMKALAAPLGIEAMAIAGQGKVFR